LNLLKININKYTFFFILINKVNQLEFITSYYNIKYPFYIFINTYINYICYFLYIYYLLKNNITLKKKNVNYLYIFIYIYIL